MQQIETQCVQDSDFESYVCPTALTKCVFDSVPLTVYHVNPVTAGRVPIDMDTGDERGVLFFYLGNFLLPLECANASAAAMGGFDCSNPERFGERVWTKVDLRVHKNFTTYSACNLCTGEDPFSGEPCADGTYVCDCFDPTARTSTCDATRVGTENIGEMFTSHTTDQCYDSLQAACGSVRSSGDVCSSCVQNNTAGLMESTCSSTDLYTFCPSDYYTPCTPEAEDWVCWDENVARKTNGNWFSTRKEGLCLSGLDDSCGWEVLSVNAVEETCVRDKLMTHVEEAAPSCFQDCGPRNQTSSCWIGCFFDTLMGPEARNSSRLPLGGMAIEDIQRGFLQSAFLPESEGGCAVVDSQSFVV